MPERRVPGHAFAHPSTPKRNIHAVIVRQLATASRLILLPKLPLLPFTARGRREMAVQQLTALVWQVNDRLVERVDNEPIRHPVHGALARIDSHVQPRRVVAPVPLLQLQHAPPEVPRIVGRHALAAALGAGAGLSAAVHARHGSAPVAVVALHGGVFDGRGPG